MIFTHLQSCGCSQPITQTSLPLPLHPTNQLHLHHAAMRKVNLFKKVTFFTSVISSSPLSNLAENTKVSKHIPDLRRTGLPTTFIADTGLLLCICNAIKLYSAFWYVSLCTTCGTCVQLNCTSV